MGTPETSGLKIKPNWIKMLADSSTVWSARGLFCGLDFDFSIPALFAVSTNSELNLAQIDGGIRRRGVGVAWEIHFTNSPQAAHERMAHPLGNAIKHKEFYTAERKQGYLFFMMAVMKVFFQNDRQAITDKYRPVVVKDATWKALTSAFSEIIESWKEECCVACTLTESAKKDALLKALRTHLDSSGSRMTDAEFKLAVEASFVFPMSARSARTRDALGKKSFLKLKDFSNQR